MKSLEKYVNAKKKLIVENEKTTDNDEKYISKLKGNYARANYN